MLKKNVAEKYPDRSAIVEAAVTYEPGPVGLLDSLYVGTTASGGSSVRPARDSGVRSQPAWTSKDHAPANRALCLAANNSAPPGRCG